MHPPVPSLFGRRRFLTLTGAAALLPRAARSAAEPDSMTACLPPGKWDEVEAVVDKALAGIAAGQGPNGELGEQQPAATAMAVMAFLSRGHIPGEGRYGEVLTKAVDSVLAAQDDRGVFGASTGNSASTYHHAISGLMLGELYGQAAPGQSLRIRQAIVKALAVTRRAQATPKQYASAKGGVRYFNKLSDADLSVTGWHFMFYRSARNAEFDVPESWVTEMLQFVYACRSEAGGFSYQPNGQPSFAMSAVGLLCMTMTGKHDHPIAVATARMLKDQDFDSSRRVYGMYYGSLALAQMGGANWNEFYPRLVEAQLADPRAENGVWQHTEMGAVLDSAFRILSLTTPCQLLPIFQR